MTTEDAISYLKWVICSGNESEDLEYHGVSVKNALEMAIKALENQANEDLISRKSVLDLAKDLTFEGGCKHRCVDVLDIYSLPTMKESEGKE